MNQIHPTAEISRSLIQENLSAYMYCRIIESDIGKDCIVGDFSRVISTKLSGTNKVDRNTFITNSEIGLYTYFGNNDMIFYSTIGSFCSISWGVTIGAANHDYSYITTHDFLYNKNYKINPNTSAYNRFSRKTVIGNDVWVGANSTIVNGIKIADGAIIGANTIVTKDVPPYAIIVGNPGKILKFRFSEEVINELLMLKWWEMPDTLIANNFNLFAEKDIHNVIREMKKIKNEYINNISR